MIGSRSLISLSSMRQKETTREPVRSEPKLGKACACLPSRKAATESNSAAVTTPCPPRPCMRTWNMHSLLGHQISAVRCDGILIYRNFQDLFSEARRGLHSD